MVAGRKLIKVLNKRGPKAELCGFPNSAEKGEKGIPKMH
jgi:hypothetical protein